MKTTRNSSSGTICLRRWYKGKRHFVVRSAIVLFIVILFWTSGGRTSYGQGVGISESSIVPQSSSILELRSTLRGFLAPRMTTGERLAIALPAQGLLVYDTDKKSFFYWETSNWKAIAATALGTANQLLGMDAAGLANEYKTLNGSSNILVGFSPGNINLTTIQDIYPAASPTFAGLKISSLAINSGVYTDGFSYLTTTPPLNGNLGYWNRTGTVLTPSNTGDAVTTSGYISTTGSGTISASGLLSGTSGLTVTGGGINLNNNSNNPTNINTGNSSGPITLGNSLNTITLPAFTIAGVVHNSATGLLSSSLIVNSDISNSTIDLTTKITGVLKVINGGTGQSDPLVPGGVLYGSTALAAGTTAAGTTGQMLRSTGAGAPVWSNPAWPNTATLNKLLIGDGTNWTETNATWPNSTTVNQILYSFANNDIRGLPTANNGILVTSGAGVPSIGNTVGAPLSMPSINLTSNINQLVLGTGITGTLSWSPTIINKLITFPDSTGRVALLSNFHHERDRAISAELSLSTRIINDSTSLVIRSNVFDSRITADSIRLVNEALQAGINNINLSNRIKADSTNLVIRSAVFDTRITADSVRLVNEINRSKTDDNNLSTRITNDSTMLITRSGVFDARIIADSVRLVNEINRSKTDDNNLSTRITNDSTMLIIRSAVFDTRITADSVRLVNEINRSKTDDNNLSTRITNDSTMLIIRSAVFDTRITADSVRLVNEINRSKTDDNNLSTRITNDSTMLITRSGVFDARIIADSVRLVNEINRSKTDDNNLSTRITNDSTMLITRSGVFDTRITADSVRLVNEINRSKTDDNNLSTRITNDSTMLIIRSAVFDTRITADSVRLVNEINRSKTDDNNLSTRITNDSTMLITRSGVFDSRIIADSVRLVNEIARSKTDDNNLSTRITNDSTMLITRSGVFDARIIADSVRLVNEINRSKTDDNNLSTRITNDSTMLTTRSGVFDARIIADSVRLVNEIARSTTDDNNLSTRITNDSTMLITRSGVFDARIIADSVRLVNEINRSKTDDNNLSTRITNDSTMLITRSGVFDSRIIADSVRLVNEIARSKTDDNNLSTRITNDSTMLITRSGVFNTRITNDSIMLITRSAVFNSRITADSTRLVDEIARSTTDDNNLSTRITNDSTVLKNILPFTDLGDLVYGTGLNSSARLAGNTTTTPMFLKQTGTGIISAAPGWAALSSADVGLNLVENTTLSTWAGSLNLVTLGTITAGTWNGTTISIANGGTGAITVLAAKTNFGLENVNNTTDLNKPISTATQTALNLKADLASPTLTGVPLAPTAGAGTNTTQIATTAFVTDAITTATPDATAAVKGKVQLAGDLGGTGSTAAAPVISDNAITTVKISDANVTYGKIQNVAADKVLGRVTAGAGVIEEISTTGTGNVVRANSPTFTGTVSGITQSMVGLGNVTNESKTTMFASPTFTGTVSGIDKTMVGLGSVDNTSDLGKPISTLTQAALDLKANIASPTFTGTVTSPTINLSTTSNQIVLQGTAATGTLSWTPTTSNKTIIFPDESGTVALTGSTQPQTFLGDLILDAAGTTWEIPRKIGINNWNTTGNAARYSFGDQWNALQSAYGGRMQLTSYHGIDIVGNRRITDTLGFGMGSATNASLNVIGTRPAAPVLTVTAAGSQTANMQEWRSSGATPTIYAAVNSTGVITSSAAIRGAIAVNNINGGSTTLSAADMVGGVIIRTGAAAAYSDATATATSIIAAIPNAKVGTAFDLTIINTVGFDETITNGTGVTLSGGPATIAATTWRRFIGVITNIGTPAVTLYSIGSGTL